MFRKLHQYFLTHHPLMWNMRAYIMLPLIAVANILFFLSGLSDGTTLPDIGLSDRYYNDETLVAFSVLLAIIIFIIWLVFYLRNNAFKKFFPLGRLHLQRELLIILLIVFGLCFFSPAFYIGKQWHMRTISQQVNLKEEVEVVNLAAHFIPVSFSSFDHSNSCDSQKARELRYGVSSEETSVAIAAPAEVAVDTAYIPTPDTISIPPSYLFYCDNGQSLSTEKLRNRYATNEIATRWLMQGKKDSIEWILTRYLDLCRKYKATYDFDPKEQVRNIFATSSFRVLSEINEQVYDTIRQEWHYIGPYINPVTLTSAHYNIDNAREPYFRNGLLIAILYITISIALALFSFRITKLRTWFIALVGMGILSIFYGIVVALTSYGFRNAPIEFYLVLLAAFLIIALINIYGKKRKTVGGVAMLWFLWTIGFFIPAVVVLIQYAVWDRHSDITYTDPPAIYTWLNFHWDEVFAGNLLFVLLLVMFFIIPLARRWQANPEE